MFFFWGVMDPGRRWTEEKKNELMLLRWPLPLGVHAGHLPALANCRLVSLDDLIGRFGSGWKERQLGWATGLELSTSNLALLMYFSSSSGPTGRICGSRRGPRLRGRREADPEGMAACGQSLEGFAQMQCWLRS